MQMFSGKTQFQRNFHEEPGKFQKTEGRNVSVYRIFSLMTLFPWDICVKIGAESFQLRTTAEGKGGAHQKT